MPAFPRQVVPNKVTMLNVLGPLVSIGPTGRVQSRDIAQQGRWWSEDYGPLRVSDAAVRGWLAQIRAGWALGTVWDIGHYSYLTKNGGGTGSPTVSGGGQTGSTLVTTGWGGSDPRLRAGDIIRVAGMNYVLEITADTSSGSLPIFPPIPAGDSPANGASIIHQGVPFRVVIAEPPNIPLSLPANGFLAGVRLTFREAA